jgi:hypothetical protein
MKKRFTEAQIAFALRQAASGTPIFSYVYFALTQTSRNSHWLSLYLPVFRGPF